MSATRRRILLTGATSGIGLALAHRLAPRHDLLLTGRKQAAETNGLLPAGAAYVFADQREPEAAIAAIQDACDRLNWNAIDNAILNAGAGYATTANPESPAQIIETLDVNLGFAIAASHVLFNSLAKANGTLTLIGSAAHKGAPDFPAYAASKGGLAGLARALREEWRGRIWVQIIHPGPTRTGMHEKAGYDPGALRGLFLSAGSAAAMIEIAIASRRPKTAVSWPRYMLGGAVFGRRL